MWRVSSRKRRDACFARELWMTLAHVGGVTARQCMHLVKRTACCASISGHQLHVHGSRIQVHGVQCFCCASRKSGVAKDWRHV